MNDKFDDFLDDEDNPEADFQIPKELEEVVKVSIYELAVRNFIATFSKECTKVHTLEEKLELKEDILNTLYAERPDYEYHKEIEPDVYTQEMANKVFDELIKRNGDGEYFGKNKIFNDVAAAITVEIYEKFCLKMVDEGKMELYYDNDHGFGFRPKHKKSENPINKSNKPRRRKRNEN